MVYMCHLVFYLYVAHYKEDLFPFNEMCVCGKTFVHIEFNVNIIIMRQNDLRIFFLFLIKL